MLSRSPKAPRRLSSAESSLRAELQEARRLHNVEVEQHAKTRQQLETLQESSLVQRVQDETLALRISECMQRMFAAEEASLNIRRHKDLLEHELRQAQAEFAQKNAEANDVCLGLKAVNQQLIDTLEAERVEAAAQLAAAQQDALDARSQAGLAEARQAELAKQCDGEAERSIHIISYHIYLSI